MLELTTLSYLFTMLCFVALLGHLFIIWRGQLDLFLYIVSALFTTLWASASFIHLLYDGSGGYIANSLDILRNVAWFILIFHIIRTISVTNYPVFIQRSKLELSLFLAGLLTSISTLFIDAIPKHAAEYSSLEYVHIIGHILLLSSGLVLLRKSVAYQKQLSSDPIKHFLYVVCALYISDILFFSTFIFSDPNGVVLSARAIITGAICIILFVITSKVKWSKSVCVSHHTANRFILFVLTIIYILISTFLITFVQRHSQEWGALTVTLTSIAAALLFISVFSSERRRAQLRVFLNKHFFNYKYDYRDEWLRFIRTLSKGGAGAHLLETVIEALAQIVNSRGGMLWLSTEDGSYDLAASREILAPETSREPQNSSLIVFLKQWQWIINLDEYKQDPDLYQDLELPPWLLNNPKAWLIVPLMQDIELLGFVVIPHPAVKHNINWEDHDLLKTAGRQAATHLAQLMTVQALVEAREFQAFSKLSAFVIHDLKNLVAQLTLVVNNAAKHKHNPEFMEDAIKTVDHSVSKMNRLLTQLRQGRTVTTQQTTNTRINLDELINEVVQERHTQEPRPHYQSSEKELFIAANHDRLAAVLEHIIQNAQEATPPDGWVKVHMQRLNNTAVIEVTDNGCGMDLAFIRTRLFRPFDSTKGQGGMGIGVYESREYIRELKGDIQVKSNPGEGSTFTISLPIT